MARRKSKQPARDCDQCLEWRRQWPRHKRDINKATTWRQWLDEAFAFCAACASQFDQESEALRGLD